MEKLSFTDKEIAKLIQLVGMRAEILLLDTTSLPLRDFETEVLLKTREAMNVWAVKDGGIYAGLADNIYLRG